MKKTLAMLLGMILLATALASCNRDSVPTTDAGVSEKVHLSDLVGVWTDGTGDTLYRFTPTGLWYQYNGQGEVSGKGTVSFDGETLTLRWDETGEETALSVKGTEEILEDSASFRRTEAQSSLSDLEEFAPYFTQWHENGDLEGKILTISEPDSWRYLSPKGAILAQGYFNVFIEEENTPYLFTSDDEFYATVSLTEEGLSMDRFVRGETVTTPFFTEENSSVVYSYFKEKEIEINYELGDGARLLRNGGAAYNDQRDYKRMSVNCIISAHDLILDGDQAEFDLVVQYTFRKSDLPAMTGRIYNTVRFSQYDYYSGEIFTMPDSTGNEALSCEWITICNGNEIGINCEFSSDWEYPKGDEILVHWVGTYHLTMPRDYDGLVICLRPVFNSYSAQISAESVLQEDTLALEDLGEDVGKSIYCRIDVDEIALEKGYMLEERTESMS